MQTSRLSQASNAFLFPYITYKQHVSISIRSPTSAAQSTQSTQTVYTCYNFHAKFQPCISGVISNLINCTQQIQQNMHDVNPTLLTWVHYFKADLYSWHMTMQNAFLPSGEVQLKNNILQLQRLQVCKWMGLRLRLPRICNRFHSRIQLMTKKRDIPPFGNTLAFPPFQLISCHHDINVRR